VVAAVSLATALDADSPIIRQMSDSMRQLSDDVRLLTSSQLNHANELSFLRQTATHQQQGTLQPYPRDVATPGRAPYQAPYTRYRYEAPPQSRAYENTRGQPRQAPYFSPPPVGPSAPRAPAPIGEERYATPAGHPRTPQQPADPMSYRGPPPVASPLPPPGRPGPGGEGPPVGSSHERFASPRAPARHVAAVHWPEYEELDTGDWTYEGAFSGDEGAEYVA
jgi:hypothetical protein